MTDGEISAYELETLELTDEEMRDIIGSQSALKYAGSDDPDAAKPNRMRAKFILMARMPLFKQYLKQLYEMTRALNAIHYAAETGYAIGAGEEPVEGGRINRGDKLLELAVYIAFIKGMDYVHAHLSEIRAQALGEDGWIRVPTDERYFDADERRIVDYLRSKGHEVLPNLAQGMEGAGRQGDAFVDGVKSEFKTISKIDADSNTIKQNVNDSLRRAGQARRIYLDARGTNMTKAEAIRGIARSMGIGRGKLDAVIVIGDRFDVGG